MVYSSHAIDLSNAEQRAALWAQICAISSSLSFRMSLAECELSLVGLRCLQVIGTELTMQQSVLDPWIVVVV
jgi:hypothetical protein